MKRVILEHRALRRAWARLPAETQTWFRAELGRLAHGRRPLAVCERITREGRLFLILADRSAGALRPRLMAVEVSATAVMVWDCGVERGLHERFHRRLGETPAHPLWQTWRGG